MLARLGFSFSVPPASIRLYDQFRLLRQTLRPTQRALDAGDCPALTRLGWAMVARSSLAQSAACIFLASSFSCSQAESTPAQSQLTQTIGARTRAGGDPGSVADVVAAGVDAIFKIIGIPGCGPFQGRIGQRIGCAVGRAELDESAKLLSAFQFLP